MGLANAKIELRNPRRSELEAVEIDALADTGAVHLCIPPHIQVQLQLEEMDTKEVTLADGSRKLAPYVGPIELRYRNRGRLCGRVGNGRRALAGCNPDGKTWIWWSCPGRERSSSIRSTPTWNLQSPGRQPARPTTAGLCNAARVATVATLWRSRLVRESSRTGWGVTSAR